MASTLPLNTFKTITVKGLSNTANTVVYTAPVGVTSIVLMAQISNTSGAVHQVTAGHTVDGGTTVTYLAKSFSIDTTDAASVLTGKLILESGQGFVLYADSSSVLDAVLSILETANQ